LSALPAQWDAEIGTTYGGGRDEFRDELRRQALKEIKLDPWIGEGYKIDLSVGQALSAQYATRGGDIELQVMPFAMGSAWHNTWLGYAADFGIPLCVIAALIFFFIIRTSYRLAGRLPPRTMRATLSAYIFFSATTLLLRSHTSGHTALDPFSVWWSYGALVSIWIAYSKTTYSNPPGRMPSSLDPTSSQGSVPIPDYSLHRSRLRANRPGTHVVEPPRR
jgi:hypothetical protein